MVLFLLELLIYTENYSVFTEMIFGLKPFKRIRIFIPNKDSNNYYIKRPTKISKQLF